MDVKLYDVLIVGSGPAGLTAAVYARRAGRTVLLLERGAFGGQVNYSPRIENYPGTMSVVGSELADAMVSQALEHGADIEPDEVTAVVREADGTFTVTGGGNRIYRGRTLIWAAGVKHRRLGLDGEEALVGRGISFCAICDGDFYAGKTVAVAGGGNSALGDALALAEKCKKVYVLQNLSAFTGEAATAEKLLSKPNVEARFDTVIEGLEGDPLSALRLRTAGEEALLKVDGLFVAIGLIPENGTVAHLADLDRGGYIVAGEDTTTATPGFFVAGDCRAKTIRQITTAVADGAVAAMAANAFLR